MHDIPLLKTILEHQERPLYQNFFQDGFTSFSHGPVEKKSISLAKFRDCSLILITIRDSLLLKTVLIISRNRHLNLRLIYLALQVGEEPGEKHIEGLFVASVSCQVHWEQPRFGNQLLCAVSVEQQTHNFAVFVVSGPVKGCEAGVLVDGIDVDFYLKIEQFGNAQ